MDQARQQFFARPTFRFDQNVLVGLRHVPGFRHQRAEHCRLAHERRFLAVLLVGGIAQNPLCRLFELIEGDGLHQVIASALSHGHYCFGNAAVGCQENHGCFGRHLTDSLHHSESVPIAHAHVGYNEAARRVPELGESFLHSACCRYLPSAAAKIGVQRAAHRRFVVYHEHVAHSIPPDTGRNIENVVPSCRWLSTQMLPLCCSITFLQTERPKPGLPALVVNPGSKIFSSREVSIPFPSSSKSICTMLSVQSPAHWSWIFKAPPCFIA